MTFFQVIKKKGFPSRFARFCCSELKEYKIKDTAILGIRREESRKRAERYKEPIICRIYNKTTHVNQVLPILEWSKEDIEEFVKERGIRLHPLYYREDGTLDCSRRLGCLGCPLQSDKGLQDFRSFNSLCCVLQVLIIDFRSDASRLHCLKNGFLDRRAAFGCCNKAPIGITIATV